MNNRRIARREALAMVDPALVHVSGCPLVAHGGEASSREGESTLYTLRLRMDALARWLARHALLVVLANLLLGAFLGFHALHIRIENSLESMLPAGDPAVEYYNQTRAIFGSDDVAVVGVRADDLFAPATLAKIARVTDALARVPGVERVLSLTNAVDPAADVINPPPLLPRIPPSTDEVATLREKLRTTPLYGNTERMPRVNT